MLLRHWRNTGRKPDILEARPELPEDLQDILDSFHALSRSRPRGMGYGPIPFEAIDRYAKRFGPHEPGAFRTFYDHVTALDGVWLNHKANQ